MNHLINSEEGLNKKRNKMKKIFTYDEEFGVCAILCYIEQRPVIEKDYIDNIKEIWEQLYAEQEGLDE